MPGRYHAFLARCWYLGQDEYRLEIEHIQSGAKTRVTSLAAALDWMATRVGDPTNAAAVAAPAGSDQIAESAGTPGGREGED